MFTQQIFPFNFDTKKPYNHLLIITIFVDLPDLIFILKKDTKVRSLKCILRKVLAVRHSVYMSNLFAYR